MNMPHPPYTIRAHLADDYNINKPETLVAMFIRDKQFNLQAKNTYPYARYQLANFLDQNKRRRCWKDTTYRKIKTVITQLPIVAMGAGKFASWSCL
jgi:hypothetical protein